MPHNSSNSLKTERKKKKGGAKERSAKEDVHSLEPKEGNGCKGKQNRTSRSMNSKLGKAKERDMVLEVDKVCQKIDDGDECVEMEVEGQGTEFYSEDETISEIEMDTVTEEGEIEEDLNNNASVIANKRPRLNLDLEENQPSRCDSRAETERFDEEGEANKLRREQDERREEEAFFGHFKSYMEKTGMDSINE